MFLRSPCEMQYGLDLLRPDYTKERNKREGGYSLGFGATVHQKENGVRAQSVGFLQTDTRA